jgi:hypothetical protein
LGPTGAALSRLVNGGRAAPTINSKAKNGVIPSDIGSTLAHRSL